MRELEDDFINNVLAIDDDPYNQLWQNVVFQAMISTCSCIYNTFSRLFLPLILVFRLILFILYLHYSYEVTKLFCIQISETDAISKLCGFVIFVLYLVYDFDRLEKANASGDALGNSLI